MVKPKRRNNRCSECGRKECLKKGYCTRQKILEEKIEDPEDFVQWVSSIYKSSNTLKKVLRRRNFPSLVEFYTRIKNVPQIKRKYLALYSIRKYGNITVKALDKFDRTEFTVFFYKSIGKRERKKLLEEALKKLNCKTVEEISRYYFPEYIEELVFDLVLPPEKELPLQGKLKLFSV